MALDLLNIQQEFLSRQTFQCEKTAHIYTCLELKLMKGEVLVLFAQMFIDLHVVCTSLAYGPRIEGVHEVQPDRIAYCIRCCRAGATPHPTHLDLIVAIPPTLASPHLTSIDLTSMRLLDVANHHRSAVESRPRSEKAQRV